MARAGAHGRGSGAALNAENILNCGNGFRIAPREIRESLEGSGFHERGAIIEPGLESFGGAAGLGPGEREPADDQGQIPAQLDEAGISKQAEKSFFVLNEGAVKGRRRIMGNSFEDVGGAAGDAGIVVP